MKGHVSDVYLNTARVQQGKVLDKVSRHDTRTLLRADASWDTLALDRFLTCSTLSSGSDTTIGDNRCLCQFLCL